MKNIFLGLVGTLAIAGTSYASTAPAWQMNTLVLPSATVGTIYSVDLNSYVSNPSGGALTFSLAGSAPGTKASSFLSLTSAGVLSGTPARTDGGMRQVTVTVTAADGGTATTTANIIVMRPRKPPTIF